MARNKKTEDLAEEVEITETATEAAEAAEAIADVDTSADEKIETAITDETADAEVDEASDASTLEAAETVEAEETATTDADTEVSDDAETSAETVATKPVKAYVRHTYRAMKVYTAPNLNAKYYFFTGTYLVTDVITTKFRQITCSVPGVGKVTGYLPRQ